MLLMITIGYVFSYLIPTKQKSISFAIHSTKAFFLAQSGVEFAVRYAIDSGYTTPVNQVPANLNNLDGIQRNLGDRSGRFTLDYDRPNNTLVSIGVIPNGSERRVKVSNFTSFLQTQKGVILDPRNPSPCWTTIRTVARFYIRNAREESITITGFAAYWGSTGPARRISTIDTGVVGTTPTQKYSGNYGTDSDLTPSVAFNRGGNSQAIASDQAIQVIITWSDVMTTCTNIIVRFYTSTGISFTFYLDPNAVGLGSC
ncbi:MAG: hypothetical protein A2157_06275 [Deltaproteobacteria bacterium RBG_16_47_11]|nr:MAG: hypothetical protein A2157_06275 [Deltaproteobacteria bacterium RBG_16_47_11]